MEALIYPFGEFAFITDNGENLQKLDINGATRPITEQEASMVSRCLTYFAKEGTLEEILICLKEDVVLGIILQWTLFILDSDISQGLRTEMILELEEELEKISEEVLSRSVLFKHAVPSVADMETALDLSRDYPRTTNLFNKMKNI